MTENYPLISVFLPTKNERDAIEKCLVAFLNQTYPHKKIEIVIADHSNDGTMDILKRYQQQYPDWLNVYNNPTGQTAEGYTIALMHSKGEILAHYIGHAYPAPDYIERIVDELSSPYVDIVGGKVIPIPMVKTLSANAIAIALKSPFTVGYNAYTRKKRQPIKSTHWMAVKRSALKGVNEFDPQFIRGQDCDWFERIIENGAQAMFNPKIISYYYSRGTLYEQSRIQILNSWNRMRLYWQTGRGLRVRHLLPVVVLLCIIIVLIIYPTISMLLFAVFFYFTALIGISTWISKSKLHLTPIVGGAIFSIHLGHLIGMISGAIYFGVQTLFRKLNLIERT